MPKNIVELEFLLKYMDCIYVIVFFYYKPTLLKLLFG